MDFSSICIPRNICPVTMLLLTTVYQIFPGTLVGNDLQTHLITKKYNQLNESGQDNSEGMHEEVYLTFRTSVMCVCEREKGGGVI